MKHDNKLLLSPIALALRALPLNTLTSPQVSGHRLTTLNTMHEDNGIVAVLPAEDIGTIPDTNLAQSLQWVPGVLIDRDAGEGRSTSVRDRGPDFVGSRTPNPYRRFV